MSNCEFENTDADLSACFESLKALFNQDVDPLENFELVSAIGVVTTCLQITRLVFCQEEHRKIRNDEEVNMLLFNGDLKEFARKVVQKANEECKKSNES